MAAAQATDAANVALIAMENRALALTRQGRLAEATAVFDASYDEQKRLYARGMRDTMTAITQAVDERLAAHRRTVLGSAGVAAVAFALVVWLWLRMLARIRRYIRDRSYAEDQLVARTPRSRPAWRSAPTRSRRAASSTAPRREHRRDPVRVGSRGAPHGVHRTAGHAAVRVHARDAARRRVLRRGDAR